MAAAGFLASKPSPCVMTTRDYPSLFDPDSEDEHSSDTGSDAEDKAKPSLLPLDLLAVLQETKLWERGCPHKIYDSTLSHPSPPKELIREAPDSLESLLEHLLPRLQPRAAVRGVSLEDQQNFVSILVGELASQFSVIQHQIDDPFLTHQQNKTLHRRVVVQVCRIVEELYAQYIAKAAKLCRDGVFSLAANLSRLRAQLTLQANRSLNIPAIRRQVLGQLRAPLPTKPSRLPPIPPRWEGRRKRKSQGLTVDLEELRLDEPLKTKLSRFGVRFESGTVRHRVQKLKSRIPKLASAGLGAECDRSGIEEREDLEDSRPATREPELQRVPSMPELWGDFLLCDLGLTTRHRRMQREEPRQHLLGIERPKSVESIMDLKLAVAGSSTDQKPPQLGDYTFKELSEDLHGLSTLRPSLLSSTNLNQNGAEDLHPLLQAHVHGLSEKRAQRLAELDLRARQQEEGEKAGSGRGRGSDSPLEHSIPSVPTMEQLPYLTIQHASGSSSSHPSMHVKSNASLSPPRAAASSALLDSSMPAFSSRSFSPEPRDSDEDGGTDIQQLVGSPSGAAGLAQQFESWVEPSHSHLASSLAGSDSSIPHDSTLLQSKQLQEEGVEEGGDGRIQLQELGVSAAGLTAPSVGGGPLLDSTENLCQSQVDVSGSTNMLSAAFSSSWGKPADLEEDEVGEEWEEEEEEEEEEGRSHPQPATVTTMMNNKKVVRTSDIRVSERVPLNSLQLKPFGPIYNELTGELDASMIENLDSTLNEGKEIGAMYQEINKTLSTNHLQFESEPTLEPTIDLPVDLSQILASGTLHHRQSRRVMNPYLHPPSTSPPWGRGTSRKEWEKSNQYQGPDLQQFQITLGSGPLSPRTAQLARVYTTWLNWWRSTIDSEDYLKYASREESDYLHLVYHLYDSDDNDSEAEQEEKERREQLAILHAKLKAKEARWQKLHEQKSHYEAGMWNVNAVMMGGLGGDPRPGMSSSDEGDTTDVSEHKPAQHQHILRTVWTRLHFPEAQQMDMAIKYSSHQFATKLSPALELWTRACSAVEERESFLSRLETFEKEASDPSRFFAKGQRGSSAARLEEARTRDRLHKKLNELDCQVSQIIKKLELEFGDIVTYKGRPYHKKMGSDRTEMLYWLQQERRQAVLRPALRSLDHRMITQPPTTAS